MSQNVTEPSLTASEKRLLDVIADPGNINASVTDLCRQINCDRQLYYRAYRKPHFVEAVKTRALELVKGSIVPIVNAAAKEAKSGSFQHSKLLLEMAGMHTDALNLSGGIKIIMADNTDELAD